jgi:hypothetical protein
VNRITTVTAMSFAAIVAAGFTVASSDDRIEQRVDAGIRATVASIVDSLQREGLSPEPLVDYALEGMQKRANPQLILTGVRKWARDLRRARQLLGPNAKADEVEAGANAIRAGVDERHLTRIRESRKEQRFATALNTTAYIITRGVPADTAATVLINVALASASDADIKTLQDEIERDISGGTPPGMSVVARGSGLLDAISAGRGGVDGVVPGTALPSTRGTARPADPMANPNTRGSAVGNKGDAARPPAPRGKDTKRP